MGYSSNFRKQQGDLEGVSVLVVEDDVLQAVELEDSLQEAGAKIVGPAFSIQDARRCVRDEPFDVAVVDYYLDGYLATPVLEELYHRRTPFIVLTGYSTISGFHGSWRGCSLLPKPGDMTKVIKRLETQLRWARQELRQSSGSKDSPAAI